MKQHDLPNVDVSRETEDRLRAYVALLRRWNATINLVARGDEALIWDRHVRDSLVLIPIMPSGISEATDLGSGGGFPGLVLAIATGCRFTLIDSDERKSAFLREAIRATEAPARVHTSRIETANVPPAQLLTARAVAALPTLLDWAAPLLAPGGICIFPKGRSVEAELTAAAVGWHMRVDRFRSPTDPASTILRISEIARVGTPNPRGHPDTAPPRRP